jgi:hypothetical protein|tara:strand:- start:610 stop:777 length:168 start_codon:yes stop_codon:yes gene_type:complete
MGFTEALRSPTEAPDPREIGLKNIHDFRKIGLQKAKLFGIFEGLKRYFRKYYRVP